MRGQVLYKPHKSVRCCFMNIALKKTIRLTSSLLIFMSWLGGSIIMPIHNFRAQMNPLPSFSPEIVSASSPSQSISGFMTNGFVRMVVGMFARRIMFTILLLSMQLKQVGRHPNTTGSLQTQLKIHVSGNISHPVMRCRRTRTKSSDPYWLWYFYCGSGGLCYQNARQSLHCCPKRRHQAGFCKDRGGGDVNDRLVPVNHICLTQKGTECIEGID